ncbi:MAG: hypothetical protein EHM58_03055 [Ignavibacteriae bacterium]|nr:MAG: hypothetical protein EHM58_03055 [Ignavibacteriota bacterium]
MKRIILVIAAIFTLNMLSYSQQDDKTATTTTYNGKTYGISNKSYNYFSISPSGGAIFPLQNLKESFKPGATIALDLGYRVNREVGFFAKVGYNFMSSKITGAPVGSYLEVSAGPRYFFTHPKLKSALFVEGGVGAYNFRQNSYIADPTTQQQSDQINNTRAGVNAGIGGVLALTNSIDIMVKSKYHVIFTPNASSSFVQVLGGLEFKFR